jgi:hypothetical protein
MTLEQLKVDLGIVVVLPPISKLMLYPRPKLSNFMLLGKMQLRHSLVTPSTKKMKTRRSHLSMKSEVSGMLGKACHMLRGL